MEQKDFESRSPLNSGNFSKNNNIAGGLILVLIGIVILIKNLPGMAVYFPEWLLTWPVLLIVIGIFVGVKHNFRGAGWLVLMLIGSYFLLLHNNLISFDLRPYALPIALILIGISVMTKRNRRCRVRARHRWHERWQEQHAAGRGPAFKNTPEFITPDPAMEGNPEDYVNVNSVFGSVNKMILSKNFKGGKINCLFGGSEVNLAQADFEGKVVLNVSISFGGAEITIPSNWNVQNEVSVILGGLDDKRRIVPGGEAVKTLVLQGSVLCGGIEIRS